MGSDFNNLRGLITRGGCYSWTGSGDCDNALHKTRLPSQLPDHSLQHAWSCIWYRHTWIFPHVILLQHCSPQGVLHIPRPCFCLRDPSHWLRVAIPSNLPYKSSEMVGYDAGNDARIRILEFRWVFVILWCFSTTLWARCHPAGAFFSSKHMSPEIWNMSFWNFVILGPC